MSTNWKSSVYEHYLEGAEGFTCAIKIDNANCNVKQFFKSTLSTLRVGTYFLVIKFHEQVLHFFSKALRLTKSKKVYLNDRDKDAVGLGRDRTRSGIARIYKSRNRIRSGIVEIYKNWNRRRTRTR